MDGTTIALTEEQQRVVRWALKELKESPVSGLDDRQTANEVLNMMYFGDLQCEPFSNQKIYEQFKNGGVDATV